MLQDKENEGALDDEQGVADADETEIINAAMQSWKEMGIPDQLDKWLDLIPALRIVRREVEVITGCTSHRGRSYSAALGKRRDEIFPGMDPEQITALLWFGDNPEMMAALDTIRKDPNERIRLTLPTSAQRRVQRDAKANEEPEPARLTWKQRFEEGQRDIGDLETELRELKQAMRDVEFEAATPPEATATPNPGQLLFDPLSKPPEEFAEMIVDSVLEETWKVIVKAVAAAYARRDRPTAH